MRITFNLIWFAVTSFQNYKITKLKNYKQKIRKFTQFGVFTQFAVFIQFGVKRKSKLEWKENQNHCPTSGTIIEFEEGKLHSE